MIISSMLFVILRGVCCICVSLATPCISVILPVLAHMVLSCCAVLYSSIALQRRVHCQVRHMTSRPYNRIHSYSLYLQKWRAYANHACRAGVITNFCVKLNGLMLRERLLITGENFRLHIQRRSLARLAIMLTIITFGDKLPRNL